MAPEIDQLLQSALALPQEDLQIFLSALAAAVDERGLSPSDTRWLGEIRKRSDEFDAGGVKAIPWSVVKEQARRRAIKESSRD